MKGACLLAYLMGEKLGYPVSPRWDAPRSDIVQAVQMESPEAVRAFCQMVQNYSPVDSDITLEYGEMPSYEDKVVMAAGTFIQGSSIELSCDAPLRRPYTIFWQGGLTYEHVRYTAAQIMEKLTAER